MKKIRLSCIILAAFMLLSLLAGCSANSKYAADNATAPRESIKNESQAVSEEPYYESQSENSGYGGTFSDTGAGYTQSLPENAKLIFIADIEMETTEFDSAVTSLSSLVSSVGGYFESSNLNNYSNYRYASYTVRVPSEKFEEFLSRVGENCKINNISRSTENIGEAYYDTEARLATQKTKLERLQALLGKADNIDTIIALESAISETEFAIENLSGTLRKYDSLVGYSTINLYLREVYRLSGTEQPAIGFGAKLVSAFKAGWNGFVEGSQSFVISFARNWTGWLIFFIIVIVVLLLIRRTVRRRRKRREARLAQQNAVPPVQDTPAEK